MCRGASIGSTSSSVCSDDGTADEASALGSVACPSEADTEELFFPRPRLLPTTTASGGFDFAAVQAKDATRVRYGSYGGFFCDEYGLAMTTLSCERCHALL